MEDYNVIGSPTISPAAFEAVLRKANSPALPEAHAIYRALVATGVDPVVWLAFGWVESKLGTTGIVVKHDTKNMGNVRSPEVQGAGTIVQTVRGPFAMYDTWTKGATDWGLRLNGPKYRGAGLTTVRQVLPKYAPAADANDPDAYARAVLAHIARYASPTAPGEQKGPTMPNALAPLATRQLLMKETNGNWGKTTMRGGWPTWITVHETGNRNPNANAEMHANFVKNGGGEHGVSFHACVDEKESIQIMPWNWVAWHASDGNGDGNYDSIAIETCQIGDFAKTTRNLVALVAKLMKEFSIPLANVVQHNHWAPDKKNCPEMLRARDQALWKGFVAAVSLASRAPQPPALPTLEPVVTERQDWGGRGRLVRQTVVVVNEDDPQHPVYYENVKEYEATGPVIKGWREV